MNKMAEDKKLNFLFTITDPDNTFGEGTHIDFNNFNKLERKLKEIVSDFDGAELNGFDVK